MNSETEIAAAVEAGRLIGGHFQVGPDGARYTVIPANAKVASLEEFEAKPLYAKSTVAVEEVPAFSAYFNRFKAGESMIFATLKHNSIVGVIDYHRPDEKGAVAAHAVHRVTFNPPLALEWKRWTGVHGKKLSQVDFAQFIEENLIDIREPAGATVLEVAKTLKAKRKVDFSSGISLQDGTQQLTYVEETEEQKTRGAIDVPDHFVLGIPVYFGGQPYEVKAWLRYRIDDDAKLWFIVELHRKEYIEQDAFQALVKEIADETNVSPILAVAP